MAEYLKAQYIRSTHPEDEEKITAKPRGSGHQTKATPKEELGILDELHGIFHEMGKKYTSVGLEVGTLVDEKNAAYGDSFTKAAEFLQILYPNGIPVTAYTDALCIVRIFDKLMRLASDKGYNNERPYADIAGYALLGLTKDRERAEAREKEIEDSKPKKAAPIFDSNGRLIDDSAAAEQRRKANAMAKQAAREAYLDEKEKDVEELEKYYIPGMANEPTERRRELVAARRAQENKTFTENSVRMESDSSEEVSKPRSYSVSSRVERLR